MIARALGAQISNPGSVSRHEVAANNHQTLIDHFYVTPPLPRDPGSFEGEPTAHMCRTYLSGASGASAA
jgi:hypothetical protein